MKRGLRKRGKDREENRERMCVNDFVVIMLQVKIGGIREMVVS